MATIAEHRKIEYAPLSAIAGLSFQHFAGGEDYQIMLDIWLKNREFNGYDWVATMDDIKEDQAWRTNYDVNEQLVLVELNGGSIGYMMYHWSLQGNPRTYLLVLNMNLLEGYWDSEIPQLMLDYAEMKLAEISKELPQDAPHCFDMKIKQKNDVHVDFFSRNDYLAERYFISMVRPTDKPLEEYPMPKELEIRPVTPDDYRKVWDAHLAAFQDHWGYAERTEAQFQAWQKGLWFQPELWKVAWDGDEIAGRVGNFVDEHENKALQRKYGYTEGISVGRRWRGRGVAKALIAASIRMFKGIGMEATTLGVDIGSTTGALQLYTGLGYCEVEGKTSIVLRKTLKQNFLEKENE